MMHSRVNKRFDLRQDNRALAYITGNTTAKYVIDLLIVEIGKCRDEAWIFADQIGRLTKGANKVNIILLQTFDFNYNVITMAFMNIIELNKALTRIRLIRGSAKYLARHTRDLVCDRFKELERPEGKQYCQMYLPDNPNMEVEEYGSTEERESDYAYAYRKKIKRCNEIEVMHNRIPLMANELWTLSDNNDQGLSWDYAIAKKDLTQVSPVWDSLDEITQKHFDSELFYKDFTCKILYWRGITSDIMRNNEKPEDKQYAQMYQQDDLEFDFSIFADNLGRNLTNRRTQTNGRDRSAREGKNISFMRFDAPVGSGKQALISINTDIFDPVRHSRILPEYIWKRYLFEFLPDHNAPFDNWQKLRSKHGQTLLTALAYACVGDECLPWRPPRRGQTLKCGHWFIERDQMRITPNLLISIDYGRCKEYGLALKKVIFYHVKKKCFMDVFGMTYTLREVVLMIKKEKRNRIILDPLKILTPGYVETIYGFEKNRQTAQAAGWRSYMKNKIVKFFGGMLFDEVKDNMASAFKTLWSWFTDFLVKIKEAVIKACGFVLEKMQDCYQFVCAIAMYCIKAMCKVGDSMLGAIKTLINYFDFDEDDYKDVDFDEVVREYEVDDKQMCQVDDVKERDSSSMLIAVCMFSIQLAGSMLGTPGIFSGSPASVAGFFKNVPYVSRGLDESCKLFKRVSDAVYYYFKGDGLYSDTQIMHDIEHLCAKVSSCLKVIHNRPIGAQVPTDTAQELNVAVIKLKELQVKLTTEMSMIHQRTAIDSLLRMIDRHINDVVALLCQGAVRPKPVVVIVHGPPRAGKNDILKALPCHAFEVFDRLCTQHGKANPFKGIDIRNSIKTFQCYKQEKYMEGYVGQVCVYLDELYTCLDAEINAFWSQNLQAWLDDTAYMMEMAFGGKGCTPFSSILVMASTNAKNHHIMCKDEIAYHRRIEFDLNFSSEYIEGVSSPFTHGVFSYTQDAIAVRSNPRFKMPVVPSCVEDLHTPFDYPELVNAVGMLLFERIFDTKPTLFDDFNTLCAKIEAVREQEEQDAERKMIWRVKTTSSEGDSFDMIVEDSGYETDSDGKSTSKTDSISEYEQRQMTQGNKGNLAAEFKMQEEVLTEALTEVNEKLLVYDSYWSLSAWFNYVFAFEEVKQQNAWFGDVQKEYGPRLTAVGFDIERQYLRSAQRYLTFSINEYKILASKPDLLEKEVGMWSTGRFRDFMKSVLVDDEGLMKYQGFRDIEAITRFVNGKLVSKGSKELIAKLCVCLEATDRTLRIKDALMELIDVEMPMVYMPIHLCMVLMMIGEKGIFHYMWQVFRSYMQAFDAQPSTADFPFDKVKSLSVELKVLRKIVETLKEHQMYPLHHMELFLSDFMKNFNDFMTAFYRHELPSLSEVPLACYPTFYSKFIKLPEVVNLLSSTYGPEAAAIWKSKNTVVAMSASAVVAMLITAGVIWKMTKSFWGAMPQMVQSGEGHSSKKNEKKHSKPAKRSKTAKQAEHSLAKVRLENPKQFTQGSTAEGILRKAADCQFLIMADLPGAGEHAIAYAYRVGGSVCAFNKHVWDLLPPRFVMIPTQGKFRLIGCLKSACRVVYSPAGRDIEYVFCPQISVGKHVLKKHGLSFSEFKHGSYSTSAGFRFAPDLDEQDNWHKGWSICEDKLAGCTKPRSIWLTEDKEYGKMMCYYVVTLPGVKSGDCGLAYYANYKGGPHPYGIHSSGNDSGSATVAPMFKEDWDEIEKNMETKWYAHVGLMSFGHTDPFGMYKRENDDMISFAVRTQPYSSDIFMRTPFHDQKEIECPKAPAVLTYEAYQNAKKKEESTEQCLTVHPFVQATVMNHGVDLMKGFVDEHVEQSLIGCEFLTPEEALDGCPAKGVDSFDFTTADGPRLKKHGIKKEDVREPTSTARAKVLIMIMQLFTIFTTLGKFTYQLNMDCLKAELRDLLRVFHKKTRLFNNTDFIDNILMKMFWGHLVAKLKKHFFSGPAMCGISPGRSYWRMIYMVLKDVRYTIVDTDVQAWDLTMNFIFSYVISAWVIQFYPGYRNNKFYCQCLAWAVVASFCAMRIAFGIGRILRRGNSSGNWLTTVLNTIVNYLLHKIAYMYLCRQNGIEYDEDQFKHDFIVFLYSDDNLSTSVKNSWWNFPSVAGAFKTLFGITLTTTDKGEVTDTFHTIHDVEFLSRKFVPHEKYSELICAPLNEDSLISQLFYVRRATQGKSDRQWMLSQLSLNVDNVVRELREHKYDYARKMYDWIVRTIVNERIPIKIPDLDWDKLTAGFVLDNLC